MKNVLSKVLRIRVSAATLKRIGQRSRVLQQSQAQFVRLAILQRLNQSEDEQSSLAATGGQS